MTTIEKDPCESASCDGVASQRELFSQLAAVLDYPTEALADQIQSAREYLMERLPDTASLLDGLLAFFGEAPLCSVEELYTNTFDLSPVCSMDVGYHLFGEDYQRGLFMAQLRESLEEVGLDSEQELPDHLPVILRWLSEVYGSELHEDMVVECVLPAMRKMDESFVDSNNPYRAVLQAVAAVLKRDLNERGIDVPEVARVEVSPFEGYSGPHVGAMPGQNFRQKLLTLET
ncbi:MAG: molecular chaperone TorD family protein [Armatimonadetes bacterium]|nr:molecular chaperone TorD family protein [Armatimonadota bacterium]